MDVLSLCFQMSLLSVEEKLSGYLAKKAEKTVGCIIWETLEDNSLHLLALGKNLLWANSKSIHMTTSGVLVLHRENGIASMLLEKCVRTSPKTILFVQTSNTAAVQFYSNRKFKICSTLENYYRRLDCNTAYKMEYVSTLNN